MPTQHDIGVGTRLNRWYRRKYLASAMVSIGIVLTWVTCTYLMLTHILPISTEALLIIATMSVIGVMAWVHHLAAKSRLDQGEKLRLLSEQSLMGLMIFQKGKIIFVNRAVAQVTGVAVEELTGLSLEEFAQFIHPADRSFAVEQATIKMMGSDGAVPHYSVRLVEPLGRVRWAELYSQTVMYGGEYADFVCIVDRTAQETAQSAFKESESRFRQLVETMREGVAIVDSQQTFVYINDSLTAILGLSREHIVGTPLTAIFDQSTIDGITAQIEESRRGDRRLAEFIQIMADGRQKSILISANIIHDNQNEPTGSFVVITDITERERVAEALQNSEQMLQTVLDTIPVRVFWKDTKLNYLGCNQLFAQDAGLSHPREVIGKNDLVMPWKEQAKLYVADDRQVIESGQPRLNYEEPQFVAGGKQSWLRTTKTPLRDSDGHIIGVLGIYDDITDRKQTEEALHRSLQTAADIVEAIPAGLFIYQFEPPDCLTLVDANPEACDLTGIQLEKWRGRRFEEIWPGAYKTGTIEALFEVVNTGQIYYSENFKYSDDRLNAVLRLRAFRIPGNKLGVAIENVTEQQRAYEFLRESEGRYRFLYKNLPIMLHSIDTEGIIVGVSNIWLETMGYSRSEVIGRKSVDFMTPESRKFAVETVLPEYFVTGTCRNVPYQFVKKSGEIMDVMLSAVSERDDKGKIIRSFNTLLDVTGLREKERKILTFYRAMEQSSGTVMIIDSKGNAVYVNPRFTQVTGHSAAEVIGKRATIIDIATQQSGQDIWRLITSGETWTGTLQNRRKSGERYWKRLSISPIVDDGGEIINFLVVGEDTTAEIRTFQRLAESDKLSAIGLLAAGVAHEFKNYLCGIIGNASLLMQDIEQGCTADQIRDGLDVIIEIGERASDLTTSLLTYSKARPTVYQEENLCAIIGNTITLVEKEMKKLSIELMTYFEDVPPVYASASGIQQLILNLLINAQQAIDSRGLITTALHMDGNQIRIAVGDSGRGIAADALPHIFDPFFSTKGVWGNEDTGGTGMGLAISRNIAHAHGGELSVDSIAGIGSVFTVTLPLTNTPDSPETPDELSAEAVRRPSLIVCTPDMEIAGKYFRQAQQQRTHMYWIDSPARLEKASPLPVTAVIYDNHVLSPERTRLRASSGAERNIPIVVVNHPSGKPTASDFESGVSVCFQGTPELAIIINHLMTSDGALQPTARI